jgi:hypothetical protein
METTFIVTNQGRSLLISLESPLIQTQLFIEELKLHRSEKPPGVTDESSGMSSKAPPEKIKT